MGGIKDSHGPNQISIETRRESFYIHAGYGAVNLTEELQDLRPGSTFIANDPRQDEPASRVWKLVALTEKCAVAEESVSGAVVELPLSLKVELPGLNGYDDTAPLAKLWTDYPSPELLNDDVLHLLSALADHPACPPDVREAIRDEEAREAIRARG